MPEKQYTITLPERALEVVRIGLGKLPLEQSLSPFQMIALQVQQQDAPKEVEPNPG